MKWCTFRSHNTKHFLYWKWNLSLWNLLRQWCIFPLIKRSTICQSNFLSMSRSKLLGIHLLNGSRIGLISVIKRLLRKVIWWFRWTHRLLQHLEQVELYHVSICAIYFYRKILTPFFTAILVHSGSGAEMLKVGAKRRRTTQEIYDEE